jgi:hypothetical protein
VILIQWDGYVVNASAWDDHFLDFDYIGAVWQDQKEGFRVGNGGFSLRSKKLLTLLQQPDMNVSHPEDLEICTKLRGKLEAQGIRFADEDTASRFSYEEFGWEKTTFGFHGIYNFNRVLQPGEFASILDTFPAGLLGSGSSAYLIQAFVSKNCWREAEVMMQKIEATVGAEKALGLLATIADNNIEIARAVRVVIRFQAANSDEGEKRQAISRLPVEEAFNLGLTHHRVGRLAEAQQIYRAILAKQPNHAGATHYLGVIAGKSGRG